MAPAAGSGNREESDSEWEYEYDTEETETFYITLDLPPERSKRKLAQLKNVFAAPERSKKPRKLAKGKPRRRRRRNPITGELEHRDDMNDDNDDEPSDQDDIAERATQEAPDDGNARDITDEPTSDVIQLLDLNSSEPIISYRGSLYACKWATSLGTEMFFSKQELDDDSVVEYLRSVGSWNLIGTSSARLVASDAKLIRRQEPLSTPISSSSQPGASSTNEQEADSLAKPFLQRFVEVKIRKGEIEPGSVVVSNEGPTETVSTSEPLPILSSSPARGSTRKRGRRGRAT